MDIGGKTVLITGAANGIGAALALEFARRGADLAVEADRFMVLTGLEARLLYMVKRLVPSL